MYADQHLRNDKIERLNELLQAHGDDALRAGFASQRGTSAAVSPTSPVIWV